MRAYARLRAPDGSTFDLVPGDLIGRVRNAAMQLDDARISEAHVLLSLRERELRLIALRGGMAVDGRPVNEVAARDGLEVTLARGLELVVEAVHLPASVLGIEGAGLVRQALPPVASLVVDPHPRLIAGYVDGAAAAMWCTGSSWRMRPRGGDATDLSPGQSFEIDGVSLTMVSIPLDAAGREPTRTGGGIEAPLRIEANFDTVHLHREGAVATVLGGNHARMVSELVALGGPIHWRGLAELVWPDDPEPHTMRSRFDVTLSRLRRKLERARIRTDLVSSDGSGQIGLLLYPDDVVADRT